MTTQASEKNVPVAVKKGADPIQAFQDEMNRLFQNFFGETLPHWWRASENWMPFAVSPATDVVENDRDIKVTAELPGMDAKDVTVSVSDNYLTIKGRKEEETKEEKKGYFRQERSYGEFQRVIALPPETADTSKIEATMSKGVLTVTVPKKAGAQPKARTIEIRQAA